MQSEFYSAGLNFSCQQCSGCCRHEPGYVFLSENDIKVMCNKLNLPRRKFIKQYCRTVDLDIVKRVSLIEKSNHDCIFWNNGCTIYEARPLQCRSYPFWVHNLFNEETWKNVGVSCPGINKGKLHSKEDIDEWLDKRIEEPFVKS